ncbi:MAG TPA: ligase-associated DNA damage response endonuclease PdeM [Puia sp.]|nr:ligase-associated DNA damage response endonuclease PdeM [Puia sp.]
MQSPHQFTIQKQHLWLSAERCIFWEEERSLIVSDLHFGKTGHFRKSGIAIPQNIFKEDLQRLVAQIQHFQPKHLIVVGDFFHSNANKELELFQKWRNDFPHLSIHLVKGNHDILHNDWYSSCQINLKEKEMKISEFTFIHDIASRISVNDKQSTFNYYFSGHIHPGIRISGVGKQSLCFPCFYFSEKYAVLPAFSYFTGVAIIVPRENENVFAIVKNKLVQIQ